MHILVVEDEPKIREVLIAYLEKEGWEVDYTSDGHEAIQLFDYHKHDLVMLDLMIEGLPGEEVCRLIREKSNVPIMMLTSKSREVDAINGLNLGADDYIVKPFRVKEVVARIHAIRRRLKVQPSGSAPSPVLTFNNSHLIVDMDAGEVVVNSHPVSLTTTEFKLLALLISKPGKVFSRNDLSYHVQGYRFQGDGRSVDAHIKNLRKKIEKDSKNPQYIITMIGAGYKFTVHPDE